MINGGGATSNGHPPAAPAHQWGNAPFMTSEMPPMYCLFKCSECQISKSSCEDLEIHIKIEHLNWLPFQCTHCNAQRASDNQMREHVHSHHKKTEYIYKYIDNMQAKRCLQGMIDRALSAAIQQMVARRHPPLPAAMMPAHQTNGGPPTTPNGAVAAKRQRLHDLLSRNISHEQDGELQRPSTSVSPDDDHDQRHLSPIDAAHLSEGRPLADDPAARLSTLFGGQKSNGVDEELDDSSVSSALLKTLEAASSMNQTCHQHRGPAEERLVAVQRSSTCPKDENVFRFKCLFDGCDVEHYCKDQMENHQSKMHGRIDHSMMEDRSVELYDRVQALSMELLGTRDQDPNRRKRPAEDANGEEAPSMVENNPLAMFQKMLNTNKGAEIECLLCHKLILTRTRGFHLLNHLSSDLGIVRYCCKFCSFKATHDRPQSVSTHGKKEHGTEECVEDSLHKYTEEIKSLSKACFGLEQLFTKGKPAQEPNVPPSRDLARPLQRLGHHRLRAESRAEGAEESTDAYQSDAPTGLRYVQNKLVNHVYTHLEKAELFLCPKCDLGNSDRNMVQKHLREFHTSPLNPVDNRLKYSSDIKEMIRKCFPSVFVDAPLPTAAEMEELKKTLNLSDAQLIIDGEGGNDEENESHASDSGAEFGEGDEDDTRPDGELEQDENAEDEPMEAEVARAEEADDGAAGRQPADARRLQPGLQCLICSISLSLPFSLPPLNSIHPPTHQSIDNLRPVHRSQSTRPMLFVVD
ncbi:hypothetical protein M3Y99_01705100 [Aphelenchoides fujianensis]|nr:hypothetical protein M3Y99_01705100 [Aphelenchoides fujianensis]